MGMGIAAGYCPTNRRDDHAQDRNYLARRSLGHGQRGSSERAVGRRLGWRRWQRRIERGRCVFLVLGGRRAIVFQLGTYFELDAVQQLCDTFGAFDQRTLSYVLGSFKRRSLIIELFEHFEPLVYRQLAARIADVNGTGCAIESKQQQLVVDF